MALRKGIKCNVNSKTPNQILVFSIIILDMIDTNIIVPKLTKIYENIWIGKTK